MSTKNYSNEEAVAKLKEIAEGARICMMSTKLDARPVASRPMTIQDVDDEGVMWFLSGKDSNKNYELVQDAEVQLYFSNTGEHEYLSVYGKANIYTDSETIDQHWSEMANVYFDGKDDPNLSVIGITPQDAKYWATENGKFVDMALMVYDVVVGNDDKPARGESGDLNI